MLSYRLFQCGLLIFCSAIIANCVEQDITMHTAQNTYQPQLASASDANESSATPVVNRRYLTLSHLNLNNQGNEVSVKPLTVIHAEVNYDYRCVDCEPHSVNQIIIGLARRSAQACIYQGGPTGRGSAQFILRVPAKLGKYEIRYRVLQAEDCKAALRAGWNAENSPSKNTTIGTISVSKKKIAKI